MQTGFSTIDEYIAQFDDGKQALLHAVRKIIQRAAPMATETISYQMPTFRYQGNLIHFAMAKNHLGIYPGPAAITEFATDLAPYKTSKGAIQIPLDSEIPKAILEKMVQFNLKKLQDKNPTDWKRFHAQWTEAIEKTQHIIAQFPLDRSLKWGNEVYSYAGKNVVSYAGFKNHFAIWFYNGVFLADPEKVLVSGSEGKTKGLRQWRFTDVADMDTEKIKTYIAEAIQTVVDGKAIIPEKGKPLVPNKLLAEALAGDKQFNQSFFKLTPGRQREYNAYIDEAKQDKTKVARLEKIKPLVAQGVGLHDKYKD